MRRLFLHIGAHKTGTTALQHCLAQNRAILAEHGYCFASAPDQAQLHPYLGFVSKDTLLPDGFTVVNGSGLAERLATAPQDTVIASSENFSFFFQPAAIETLARIVKPLFDEIRILCYLRRQDSHAVSHHQEGAKPRRRPEGALWGHALSALPQATPEQALYLDYNRRLGLWADVFGPKAMIIRLYDRALLKGGDIVEDVLDQVGLGSIGLRASEDRNVSLGAAQAKTGHVLNAAGVRAPIAHAILDRIQDDGRQQPSRRQARAFLQPYLEGNRALNARFGISPYPDLFPGGFDNLPETPQDQWSEKGASNALRSLVRQLQSKKSALDRITAEDLHLAAVALQHAHPASALRLVDAALALRPDGQKLLDLKAELQKSTAEPPPSAP